MKQRKAYCKDHGGRALDHTNCPDCEADAVEESAASTVPELLDKITDVVLAYRPKPKSKGGKKRVRKAKKAKADAQER